MVRTKKIAFADDILGDMAQHVASEVCQAFNLPPEQVAHVVKRVEKGRRHEWAGQQVRVSYIATRDDEIRSDRNERIVRDYLYGERVPLLSRRYGLSERRIWQIIHSLTRH